MFVGVVEAVGRRWTAAVLLASVRGARRFAEYRRHIDGISDRMLTQRLRELEAMRLIEREVVPTMPVQVLYRPTETGVELLRALQPLIMFGHQYPGTVRS